MSTEISQAAEIMASGYGGEVTLPAALLLTGAMRYHDGSPYAPRIHSEDSEAVSLLIRLGAAQQFRGEILVTSKGRSMALSALSHA